MFESTSNKKLAFGFLVFTVSVLALSLGLGLGLSSSTGKKQFDPVALGYYPTQEQVRQVTSVRGEECFFSENKNGAVVSIMGQIQYIGSSSLKIPVLVVAQDHGVDDKRNNIIFLHGYYKTSDISFDGQVSQPVVVQGTMNGGCAMTPLTPFSTLPPNYGGGVRPRYMAIVFFYFQDQLREEAFPKPLLNLTDKLFNEKFNESVNSIFKRFSGLQNNVTFTGLLDATRPDIYGPVQIPYYSTDSGCFYGSWTVSAVKESNIKTFLYDYIMFVGSPTESCPFLGTAVLSGPWSIVMTENFVAGKTGVQGHELGHCLGLNHAGSIYSCRQTKSILNCSIDPYGDAFDLMSGSNKPFINAFSRESLGWMEKPVPLLKNLTDPQNFTLCKNDVVKIELPIPVEIRIETRLPANQKNSSTSFSLQTQLLTHLYIEHMDTVVAPAILQQSQNVTEKPFLSLRLAPDYTKSNSKRSSYRLEQDLMNVGDKFDGMGTGIKILILSSDMNRKCLMIDINQQTGV